jgi:hypothetical protein
LVWRYRRWRARHFRWQADVAYRRWPSPANGEAWAHAEDNYRKIDLNRP